MSATSKRVSSDAAHIADAVKRSAYLQRIRRSFLLRVHPDRFRAQSVSIRNGQSELLKAFTNRLASSDFIHYGSCNAQSKNSALSLSEHEHRQTFHYYLENDKSGSLEQYSIDLNQSVHAILMNIYEALRTSGVQHITPPPPPCALPALSQFQKSLKQDESNTSSSINRSFDINTNRNRNLLFFLQHHANLKEIQERKVHRLDAQTAALVARHLFHFSSIDGTQVGWSSSSLAKSLSTLAKLHDDHHHKFQVPSFYPFRLIISNHDSYEHKVDLFGGGSITLHPAATPIQWLDTLLSVTPDDLQLVHKHQDQQHNYITRIQNKLHLQVRKGYTCPSHLYYAFLKALHRDLGDLDQISPHPLTQYSSTMSASTKSQIHLILEADDTYSMEKLHHNDETNVIPLPTRISPSGHIHISIQGFQRFHHDLYPFLKNSPVSALSSILACLEKYRQVAQVKRNEQVQREEEFKEHVQLLKVHYGLTRVFKVVPSLVTMDQLINASKRFLDMDESRRNMYRSHLAGQSLGITGSGPSCHLGDDGSIIIPWDWS